MQQKVSENRMMDLDVLKSIGILLMVMGHVGFGEQFSKYIHAFHMQLFFFASGFFFNTEKKKPFLEYVKNNAKSLLVPYVVFTLICQPLHYIYTHSWNLRYFLLSIVSSNHNRIDVAGAFWFLLCLFSAKCLFHLIMSYTKGAARAICIIALSAVSSLRLIKLPLCMDSAMSMLVFMYAGWLIRQCGDRRVERLLSGEKPYLAVLAMVLLSPLLLLCPSVNVRTNSMGMVPVSWLTAVAMILCLLVLSRAVSKSGVKPIALVKRGAAFIGRNSIVYLVLNEIMIFAATMLLHILHIPDSGILSKLLVTVLVMVSLSVAVVVFNKTPLKVLIGRF